MTVHGLRADQATATWQLLSQAQQHRGQPAVARETGARGFSSARAYSYGQLADVIGHAAAGLAGRGLRPRDAVGLLLPDAACYVLASHAVRAAGGIPSPVMPGRTVPEIAGQLADCGARMLLTAPPLAAAAQAAADQSWVRQVISFGEAAGATTFDTLLGTALLAPAAARPDDVALLPYHRGPGGSLTPAAVTHQELSQRTGELAAAAPVRAGDVVLAVPPAGDGVTYTAALDHVLLAGATVVAVPAGQIPVAAAALGAVLAIVASTGQAAGCGKLPILVAGEPGPLGPGYGG